MSMKFSPWMQQATVFNPFNPYNYAFGKLFHKGTVSVTQAHHHRWRAGHMESPA